MSSSRYYEGTETHFLHANGFVKLDKLDEAPTVVHVVLSRQPGQPELQQHLERALNTPVYLSMYYGTPEPELDIYALVPADAVLRALGVHERVLRAEVRRRRA